MKNWSLAQSRQQRADARAVEAAGREARGETFVLDFGGDAPVELAAEFPITVLAPLRALDEELAYLIRQAFQLATNRDRDDQVAGLQMMVDLLVMSPNLPTQAVDIAHQIAVNLFGEQGMVDFLAAAPSLQDIAALVGAVADWYGASLGEAFGSPASSTNDGETSKPISSGSTDSTPDVSSTEPGTPSSSERAA